MSERDHDVVCGVLDVVRGPERVRGEVLRRTDAEGLVEVASRVQLDQLLDHEHTTA